jgi:hypothetical protein
MRKKIIIVVIGILALIGIGILVWLGESKDVEPLPEVVTKIEDKSSIRTIGTSVEGRPIEAHTYRSPGSQSRNCYDKPKDNRSP